MITAGIESGRRGHRHDLAGSQQLCQYALLRLSPPPFNARPAARYVHPAALGNVSEDGEHDQALDIASETAPNYLRWIADLCSPHLGEEVMDVGAGHGAITELFADGRRVLATDLSDDCIAAMRKRFASTANVEVLQADLRQLDPDDLGRRFDSIVLINVLEHIEDDAGTLADLTRFLQPGGALVLYVPALNGLYGQWDRRVGHFRRYSKWRLGEVAAEAGLEIRELRYVNALAIPAWFVFSHLTLKVDDSPGRSLSIWDRTGVPLGRFIESRVSPPLGLNLLCVLQMRAI
jgi:2-polyprenyl-3-methyl-5-hydroxy-6-metoxy-1,4-benzoquinol methylase